MDRPELEPQETTTEPAARSGRNPVIIILGFTLLGLALALLLFGNSLFGQEEPVVVAPTDVPVLDQVPAFPTSAIGPAEISPGEADSGILEVGDEAVDFTLNDLEGNPVSLADFRGRPVVVNVWATWCAPCRIEMPELQAAHEKYQDQGLVILALDQAEPADVASDFFYGEMGLTFTPLLDVDSDVALSFGNFGVLPSTYFIDPDGVISDIHRGPMTLEQIEGYLAKILPEQS